MTKTKLIERFLESLEETCFPIQIDWTQKQLYINGVIDALLYSDLYLKQSLKMKTIEDFENEGKWIIGQGGEGYELPAEMFDRIKESENVVDFYYDQECRYVAVDTHGDKGYFYRDPRYDN